MTERDKEYYNQKISDLYAVIENQEKIIRDLQEEKKQLQQRIKEAIEMIEELKPHWLGNDMVLEILDDLLETLKGGNND